MLSRLPRIPKRKQQLILKCFTNDVPAAAVAYSYHKNAKGERLKKDGIVDVSRPCVNRYYRHYRECIYKSLRRAPRFSGEVEVDIGFFSGRSSKKTSALVRRLAGLPVAKIVAHRKKLAKREQSKQMVLGILQRSGDVYLLPIKKKDRITLEAAIRLVVEQGSTIYSDFEQGFNKLHLDGYKHESVNHSIEYVSQKGVHINGIEGFWSEARGRMGRNFRGIPRSTLPLHIKECEFRFNHRNEMTRALKAVL